MRSLETYEVRIGRRKVAKQLPAGLSDQQVRAAFADDYAQAGIDVGKAKVQRPSLFRRPPPAPLPSAAGEGSISAWNPTVSERAGHILSDVARNLFGMPRIPANQFGDNVSSFLSDFTPVGNVSAYFSAGEGPRETCSAA
jgi:hypothetical protein